MWSKRLPGLCRPVWIHLSGHLFSLVARLKLPLFPAGLPRKWASHAYFSRAFGLPSPALLFRLRYSRRILPHRPALRLRITAVHFFAAPVRQAAVLCSFGVVYVCKTSPFGNRTGKLTISLIHLPTKSNSVRESAALTVRRKPCWHCQFWHIFCGQKIM